MNDHFVKRILAEACFDKVKHALVDFRPRMNWHVPYRALEAHWRQFAPVDDLAQCDVEKNRNFECREAGRAGV